jgi:hypothetical protein
MVNSCSAACGQYAFEHDGVLSVSVNWQIAGMAFMLGFRV